MAILRNLQDLYTVVSFTFFGLLAYYGLLKLRKLRKLPPGPWGYPIVGILFSIKKEFHLLLCDYVKLFGKVLSLKMGGQTLVVLSDHKLIKKAFQSRDFTARPKTELTHLLGGYGKFIDCKLTVLDLMHLRKMRLKIFRKNAFYVCFELFIA